MNAQRQTFDCSLKALWPYNRRYHNRSAKVIHIQFIHVYIIIYIYKMTIKGSTRTLIGEETSLDESM